jgi:hypothetical protein
VLLLRKSADQESDSTDVHANKIADRMIQLESPVTPTRRISFSTTTIRPSVPALSRCASLSFSTAERVHRALVPLVE